MAKVENNLSLIAQVATRCNISLPRADNFKIKTEVIDLTESENVKIKVENEPVWMEGDGPPITELKTENDSNTERKNRDQDTFPSTSDFIPISTEEPEWSTPASKGLSLRRTCDYKYGYEDIITGTFTEKLDECLSKGVSIKLVNEETHNLNTALYVEYKDMIKRRGYKEMLKFREKLPAYVKAKEIYDAINENQVIVISGETGCGKSTQVCYFQVLLCYI